MKKIVLIKNPDGSCGILRPTLEMFDPASRTRKSMRNQGIDFSDCKQVSLAGALKKIQSSKKTDEEKEEARRELEEKQTSDPDFIELKNEVAYFRRPSAKSEAEILQWIIAKDVPADVEYCTADASKLPADNDFRDAWTIDLDAETVRIDISKAQDLHRSHLRRLRQPLLQALDVEYQIADEKGDTEGKKNIAARKQALRDVTKAKLPDNPDKLKNFIPEILTASK